MTVTNLRTERDKRNRQRIVIEAQRRRHAQDVKRQRRAIANGATASGCLTTMALGMALVAVVWKAGRR